MTRRADAARLRQHLTQTPADAIAWLDLAAAEGDLGRAEQAEAAARRAIELRFATAEAHRVLARALQAQRKLHDAEHEFEVALRLRPGYADAHRDYAQLVWMRTGRAELAMQRLDSALSAAPHDPGLHFIRSIVLEFVGDVDGALAAAERSLACEPGDEELLLHAARLHGRTGNRASALGLTQAAYKARPSSNTQIALCEAMLASGQVEDATPMLSQLRGLLPLDQYVIALEATAWRLRDDPRYHELYDYAALVTTQALDPPPGWARLDDFLRAVAEELTHLHCFVSHPFRQSVRGGGQLGLQESDLARPLIRGLFESIRAAVERHLVKLGEGNDPMRSRNSNRAALTGAWSVRLASGGSHTDHVHPRGWLSSACYIALPAAIGSGTASDSNPSKDRAGWLRFGQPGIPTIPVLGADHYIRPEPGVLALFPAYMWHGVEPFVSDEPRLTVAFDAVPDGP